MRPTSVSRAAQGLLLSFSVAVTPVACKPGQGSATLNSDAPGAGNANSAPARVGKARGCDDRDVEVPRVSKEFDDFRKAFLDLKSDASGAGKANLHKLLESLYGQSFSPLKKKDQKFGLAETPDTADDEQGAGNTAQQGSGNDAQQGPGNEAQGPAQGADTADAAFDKMPPDLQFVAAQLPLLMAFKGVTYKLQRLFMNEKTRVTHVMALRMVQQVAAELSINMPIEQWANIFAYVTEPSPGDTQQFETVEGLQAYIHDAVLPLFLDSARRLGKIKVDPSKPIVFDNQLLFAKSALQDGLFRCKYVGAAEIHTAKAAMHTAAHNILVATSYDYPKILGMVEYLGNVMGINTVLRGVEGFPSLSRNKAIDEYKKANLQGGQGNLVLNQKWGQERMGQALDQLNFAVADVAAAYKALGDQANQPNGDFYMIHADRVLPYGDRFERTLTKVQAMLAGPTGLRSAITGEEIQVNLPAFYKQPPKNLLALTPTDWERNPNKEEGSLKFRNYQWGKPIDWNANEYKAYFPSVQNGPDVAKHIRVARQSWGGSLPNVLLSFATF